MNKLGLLGGIGPESTLQYYQQIIQKYRDTLDTQEYPEFSMESINMTKMLQYVSDKDFDGLVLFLLDRVERLAQSGANFAAMASNTPHIVFDQLEEKASIPMVSIVKATCEEITRHPIQSLGLFGTKSTMTAGFYQTVGEQFGVTIHSPNEEEQAYIHEKYFSELVFNIQNERTREDLKEIAGKMRKRHGIQGLILGGTELPILLGPSDFSDLQVFDTTQIHVQEIVKRMIE